MNNPHSIELEEVVSLEPPTEVPNIIQDKYENIMVENNPTQLQLALEIHPPQSSGSVNSFSKERDPQNKKPHSNASTKREFHREFLKRTEEELYHI
jgi:hypothetical protein